MKPTLNRTTRRQILAGALVTTGTTALESFGFSRMRSGNPPPTAITQTAAFSMDAKRQDEVTEVLATLCKAVEDNEPGVLIYIAHLTAEEPSQVFFFEVYRDAAALQNHGTTPHLAKLREAFSAGLLNRPVTITRMDRVGGFSR